MASITHGERKGKRRSCSVGKDFFFFKKKKIDFLRSCGLDNDLSKKKRFLFL
jgi:hypothetical protein